MSGVVEPAGTVGMFVTTGTYDLPLRVRREGREGVDVGPDMARFLPRGHTVFLRHADSGAKLLVLSSLRWLGPCLS